MNRTYDERRANRKRKIKQRKDLVNAINKTWLEDDVNWCEYCGIKDGYFDNNNTLNACMGAGRAKKTKAKHGHASYRHKGAYGKAIDYSPHDKRQVDSMKEQIIERGKRAEMGLYDDASGLEVDEYNACYEEMLRKNSEPTKNNIFNYMMEKEMSEF